ncbi:MAG: ribonuclease III [Chitinispirillaceae bacterium]|jgi:ribonuclease-3|nr:ribonuclease III [Chitinispirillaceae bacterium]
MTGLWQVSKFFQSLFRGNASRDIVLEKLQEVIGYRFRKKDYLRHALTHKSSIPLEDSQGLTSNERLEFLGDAVLSCIVTEFLYHTYPEQHEGQLSKIKSLIVSRKILGEIAQTFDLGEYITFGVSEEKTGGRSRLSIMSNAFEALLGAMFLDGGYRPCAVFVRKFLLERIDEFLEDETNVNYKSMILEKSQQDGFGMPRYITMSAEGPDHAKEFRVGIEIHGLFLGEGAGPNKKIAQQNAAQSALLKYNREEIHNHIQGV